MNIFADIRAGVVAALQRMIAEGALHADVNLDAVAVEPPRDPAHGDMSTNAAMVLAKPARLAPRQIAEALIPHLCADPRIASAAVAGHGFVNLRLHVRVWHGVLGAVLRQGGNFGRSDIGCGKRVNVEYVSANPTGPLHVGHARGAVFGDALAALLDHAGYRVTREYYVNDAGAQVDALARSIYLRYLEAHGQSVECRDATYPGDYLIPIGQALKDKVGDAFVGKDEPEWLDDVRTFGVDAMMALIRADLAAIGVEMDVFYSERALYGTGRIEAAVAALHAKGLIYKGTLSPPKGKMPQDWKPREQTLFRARAHGDDADRPILKSDGSWTYFAPDIAYHFDKIERGYNILIDVFGADHSGYVKRMKAAVSALSDARVPLDVKIVQLVHLQKNGQPFKMSKRAGTFVTLRDLIERVGPDVTRFCMLTRKNDAPLDFDIDRVVEQSRNNPVYYVQYAHARVMSVLRKAAQAGIAIGDADLARAGFDGLDHRAELAVIAKLAEWPRLVENAARTNEPHRLAFYLYELAGQFHGLWNLGQDVPALRFVQEDDRAASQAKIALARAVSVVIANGLGILGIEPVEEMH